MAVIEDQGQLEKERAEQIVAAAEPFDGIERITVELGSDYTGESSLWIVFRRLPDARRDTEWFKDFTRYSTSLCLRLTDSGLTRFPYTRLESPA